MLKTPVVAGLLGLMVAVGGGYAVYASHDRADRPTDAGPSRVPNVPELPDVDIPLPDPDINIPLPDPDINIPEPDLPDIDAP